MSFLAWHLCPQVSNICHVPTLGHPVLSSINQSLWASLTDSDGPERPASEVGGLRAQPEAWSIQLSLYQLSRDTGLCGGLPVTTLHAEAWNFIQVQTLALPLPGWVSLSPAHPSWRPFPVACLCRQR